MKHHREDDPAPVPSTFTTLIGLDCGHTARASDAVLPGAWHMCLRCRSDRLVTTVPEEWSWRCRTCSGARQYGAAKLTASHALDAHLRKYRRKNQLHTADLFHGTALIETRRATQLATLFDAPPF